MTATRTEPDPPSVRPDPQPAPRPRRTRSVSAIAAATLESLYQHRLLATSQLGRLLLPHTTNRSYLRGQLSSLRRDGLIGSVTGRPPGRERLWFVTAAGADLVEAAGELTVRGYRMDETKADGMLQQHTLAVAEVGIAFTRAAASLGHECGRLDWIPEVAHRIRDGGRGDDMLVVDAVLHYLAVRADERRQLTFCIELDRATMTVDRLAAKLVNYARYFHYIPGATNPARRNHTPAVEGWRHRYPVFPRILIVLTGASEAALDRRAEDLRTRVRYLPHVAGLRGKVTATVTTLQRLQSAGPTAPIALPLLEDTPIAVPLLVPSRPRRTA